MILTIGIPTYNGADYLLEAAQSVNRQIAPEFSHEIEFLILDNSSSDSTPTVVESFRGQSNVSVRYVRQEKNVGFDRNVDAIFKHARGEFVWLLADDDLFLEGALARVMAVIRDHPSIGVILVNFDQYDRDMKVLRNRVDLTSEGLCLTPNDFLLHSKRRYDLVSALIFNKDAWNNADIEEGFDSNFIHVHGLMKIILTRDSYIVSRPLINMRMDSTSTGTSGDSRLSIAMDASEIIKSMKSMGHDPRILKDLFQESRRYAFNMISTAKIAGIRNKRTIAKRLIKTYNCPQLWLKWLPVIYLPDKVFPALYFAKKGISARIKFIERTLKRLILRRH